MSSRPSEGIGPKDSSLASKGKRKRKRGKAKSKPTSKTRSRKQKTKDRYAHAREDAQLEGLIPTTPEEALKSERVVASAQGEQPLPELTAQAIRNGWAVPEDRKPGLVDELVAILDNSDMPAKVKVAAFNALRQADQAQYERDHPEVTSKMKGGTSSDVKVIVSVQTNIAAIELLNKMIDDPGRSIDDCAPPDITGASSNS